MAGALLPPISIYGYLMENHLQFTGRQKEEYHLCTWRNVPITECQRALLYARSLLNLELRIQEG